MDKKNLKYLTPFKCCIIQNFPFIEEDFDAITNYQLLCKVVEYLNNTITAVNKDTEQVSKLTDAFNNLKDYVDNYFTDLNIQNEINKKLDEMAADGTLAKIINEEIFNDLNNKIDKINNEVMKFPNFFVAPFFSGFGTTNQRLLRIYVSLDGVHFNATNITATNLYDVYAGDLNLQYDKFDKKFIMAMTSDDENHDCIIFTSKNFKNWEKHYIDLGYLKPHNDLARWAPALLVDDDGTLYMSISVEYKREDTHKFLKQVLFKCTNKENLTFNKIGDIILNDKSATSNYIDGDWAKRNGVYYFIVKHENSKAIELYSTNTIEQLNSYALLNESVGMENVKLESPTICFTDTTCNIYTENYIYYQGMNLQQCKLRDFPTISNNMMLLETLIDNDNNQETNEKYNAKHGNVLFITDENAKQQILNNCDIAFNSYNAIQKKNRNIYLKGFLDTVENANKIVIYPEIGWNIADIKNVDIEILNPYNQRFALFYCGTNKGRINITKINNKNVSIVHNISDSETNNFLIFDIERGEFLNKQHYLQMLDITTGLSPNANIDIFYGYQRGSCVTLQFTIRISSKNTEDQKIATLNSYKPLTNVIFSGFTRQDKYFYGRITEAGDITINTNIEVGTFVCSASYVI